MTCCFFGHKVTPSTAAHLIEETINKLISEQGVTSFLVGNQGQFDAMALSVLRNMKIKHPSIMYNVVLAYMPSVGSAEWNPYEYGETMLPKGIEVVHPRYTISWRNKWMVNESDIVVCYINRSWGGAAKYVEMATKRQNDYQFGRTTKQHHALLTKYMMLIFIFQYF